MNNHRNVKIDRFQVDGEKAQPGDVIQFLRDGILMEGTVLPSNGENSIIVDLSSMSVKDLETYNHGYSNTVVAHSNYKVVEKKFK